MEQLQCGAGRELRLACVARRLLVKKCSARALLSAAAEVPGPQSRETIFLSTLEKQEMEFRSCGCSAVLSSPGAEHCSSQPRSKTCMGKEVGSSQGSQEQGRRGAEI